MVLQKNTVISQLSKKEVSAQEAIRIDSVRPSILDLIKLQAPNFDMAGFISINELNKLVSENVFQTLFSEWVLQATFIKVAEIGQSSAIGHAGQTNGLGEPIAVGA